MTEEQTLQQLVDRLHQSVGRNRQVGKKAQVVWVPSLMHPNRRPVVRVDLDDRTLRFVSDRESIDGKAGYAVGTGLEDEILTMCDTPSAVVAALTS